MLHQTLKPYGLILVLGMASTQAFAHDPIFGMGPHVLFKNGFEVAAEIESEKTGAKKEKALALEVTYGLTGDWALGVALPYEFKEEGADSSQGRGDIAVLANIVSGAGIHWACKSRLL